MQFTLHSLIDTPCLGRKAGQVSASVVYVLQHLADNGREMLTCCQKFAEWWGDTEAMVHTCVYGLGPDSRYVSGKRINMLETIRATVKRRYKEYKSGVSEVSVLHLPFD